MTIDQARAKLISVAQSEIGYKEKNSANNLDDPNADPGNKNYTKYSRDLAEIPDYYNGSKQGYAWCDVFVDWCFVKAFGNDTGRLMVYQGKKSYGAGTGWSARYYKDKKAYDQNPNPGDQIFFMTNGGVICHTGIVESVNERRVTTIEGNSNDQVRRVSYPRSSSYIAGYGHPDYALVASVPAKPAPVSANHPTIRKGSTGDVVKELQTKLAALGESLPVYGVDGDFGAETLKAVKSYQGKKGLQQDGIVGPLTWAAIDADYADLGGAANNANVTKDPEGAAFITYTVKKGDTLTKIAIKYHTNASALALLNGLTNPSKIYVGQKIRVPV